MRVLTQQQKQKRDAYFQKWYAENKAYYTQYYKEHPEEYKKSRERYLKSKKGKKALHRYETSEARLAYRREWMRKDRIKKKAKKKKAKKRADNQL